MKKIIAIMLCLILGLMLVGCSTKETDTSATSKWDCSVRCAEESDPDKYVTTYSDVKVASKTGPLTIQNRNNFDIVVHLLSEGEQERVSDNIPVGGCHSFLGTTDKEYTVGVHADVDEGTEIKVFVYDGEKTDPYINTKP